VGNIENRGGKLLQTVLAGQPELDRKLEAPAFRQLKQRIALRCGLHAFNPSETASYVLSRLARVGLKDQKIFSGEMLAEIHERSEGLPRLINALCDNVLLTAFALESKAVTREMLDEVSRDLRLGRKHARAAQPVLSAQEA